VYYQERHQNEYHRQIESLKPYRMETQRINTLYDHVADIKQTLNECKYLKWKLIERTNKMQLCSRIYYSNVFLIAQHVLGDTPPIIRSSKTVTAVSGLTYVFGCWPLQCHRSSRQPKKYVKPEAAITVFELLMMGGVSPETCWAIKKTLE